MTRPWPPLAHALVGHPAAFLWVSPLLYVLCFHLSVGLCSWLLPHMRSCFVLAYLAFTLGPPAWHGLRRGSTVWFSNTCSVTCAVPREVCSRFLREARNLMEYEQKVQGCAVWDEHANGCKFALWGSWWGLPWCKQFTMSHNKDGGFHAALDDKGWSSLPNCCRFRGCGGFTLTSGQDDTTRITHYERYGWPIIFPFICLLDRCWNAWHLRGMEVEMEVIKSQIEAMHAGRRESAASADHFPEGTWTSWKYDARSFLLERFQGTLLHHPSVKSKAR